MRVIPCHSSSDQDKIKGAVTILVVGGLLAGRGQMAIAPILATAWLVTVSGGMIGYLIGRYGGSKLLRRLPIQDDQLQRIEGFTLATPSCCWWWRVSSRASNKLRQSSPAPWRFRCHLCIFPPHQTVVLGTAGIVARHTRTGTVERSLPMIETVS